MSMNGAEIGVIVDGLAEPLLGGRVQKARALASEPGAVALEIRAPGQSHTLLFSTTPRAARVHRVAVTGPQPERPPTFVMLLRKWTIGAAVVAISRIVGDRIVRLDLKARDEEGETVRMALIAELTGRHANLFLVDDADTILGMLLPNKSAERALRVGLTWEAPHSPPPSDGALRAGWPSEAPEAFLEAHYTASVDRAGWESQVVTLRSRIKKALKGARRAVAAIGRDLEAIEGADTLRRQAELLRSAYGKVARGAEQVEVTDWFDEATPTVTIPLDPTRDLEANIQALFARYKRMRRGEDVALARAEVLEERVNVLAELQAQLDEATAQFPTMDPDAREDALEAFQRALVAAGVRERKRQKPAQVQEERKPYHAFTSSDGIPILVGRGSKDNDALTFHVARGNDLWLHAADVPGSHVIIRAPRGSDLPHRTLVEAALLAGHYSKARGEGVIAVSYTQRKHVRKPKGAPPGRVTLAGAKTIDVRPDEPALEALFRTRAG